MGTSMYFQGGESVSLLVLQGKNPTEQWKIEGKIKKEFDKDTKGYLLILEGGVSTTKLTLPKDNKTSLGLSQQFLILQIFLPISRPFSIEIGVLDTNRTKRRLIISSAFNSVSITSLHCQFPTNFIPKGKWIHLCLDLLYLMEKSFTNDSFRMIDFICLGGNVRLRRVFTMREAPITDPDCMPNIEMASKYTNYMDIPRIMEFPSGISPKPSVYYYCLPSSLDISVPNENNNGIKLDKPSLVSVQKVSNKENQISNKKNEKKKLDLSNIDKNKVKNKNTLDKDRVENRKNQENNVLSYLDDNNMKNKDSNIENKRNLQQHKNHEKLEEIRTELEKDKNKNKIKEKDEDIDHIDNDINRINKSDNILGNSNANNNLMNKHRSEGFSILNNKIKSNNKQKSIFNWEIDTLTDDFIYTKIKDNKNFNGHISNNNNLENQNINYIHRYDNKKYKNNEANVLIGNDIMSYSSNNNIFQQSNDLETNKNDIQVNETLTEKDHSYLEKYNNNNSNNNNNEEAENPRNPTILENNNEMLLNGNSSEIENEKSSSDDDSDDFDFIKEQAKIAVEKTRNLYSNKNEKGKENNKSILSILEHKKNDFLRLPNKIKNGRPQTANYVTILKDDNELKECNVHFSYDGDPNIKKLMEKKRIKLQEKRKELELLEKIFAEDFATLKEKKNNKKEIDNNNNHNIENENVTFKEKLKNEKRKDSFNDRLKENLVLTNDPLHNNTNEKNNESNNMNEDEEDCNSIDLENEMVCTNQDNTNITTNNNKSDKSDDEKSIDLGMEMNSEQENEINNQEEKFIYDALKSYGEIKIMETSSCKSSVEKNKKTIPFDKNDFSSQNNHKISSAKDLLTSLMSSKEWESLNNNNQSNENLNNQLIKKSNILKQSINKDINNKDKDDEVNSNKKRIKNDHKNENEAENEKELELIHDPILNCYFDPNTMKYYKLK